MTDTQGDPQQEIQALETSMNAMLDKRAELVKERAKLEKEAFALLNQRMENFFNQT